MEIIQEDDQLAIDNEGVDNEGVENDELDIEGTVYSLENIEWGHEVSFPSTRKLKQYTHRVFNRYPARSISLVPRSILYQLTNDRASRTLNVLDPFMGSGTSAIEASLQGMKVYGVELDPFARLISEVSTRGIEREGQVRLLDTFNKIISQWRQFDIDENLVPRLSNVHYWFTDIAMNDLLKLKRAIYTLSADVDLPFFKVVLADIIRPCSKAERQSLKPYISRKHIKTPAPVEPTFIKSFKAHLKAIIEYSEAIDYSMPTIEWIGDNAVNFSTDKEIDVAITSPPYINALDYVRCIKIESAWIDCSDNDSLKIIKQKQVGDLRKVDTTNIAISSSLMSKYFTDLLSKDNLRAGVVYKYFEDMLQNMKSTYNVLRANATYHIIVGNSTIRGIEVPTHEILAELGESIGFTWTKYHKYKIKDHRLSIPRNNNGGKIEFEHVISLTK